MNKIDAYIAAYEKAAEELKNVLAVAVLERKIDLTVEAGRDLMDRISYGTLLADRAERSILEGVALSTALAIVKKAINQ